ncbi:Xaa-Pro peptidase family protein [Mesorhizobium australicum]|uniref:M24 family metallopeptidase n=1 Tax=Mesorhizobium australicum TaxID=536018 RepID=UPI003338B3A6
MQPLDFPPPFPIEEYRSRLKALRRMMAERRVDLLIVNQFEHITYFGGYSSTGSRYHALLIPLDGEPVAILRALDAEVFSEMSWLSNCVAFRDNEDPIKVVADTIKAHGYGSAGVGFEFDSNYLPVTVARELERRLPKARMIDFSYVMWEMRQAKSALELDHLQTAAQICDRAVAAAFEAAQPGVNERDVFAAMTREAWRCGADNDAVAVMSAGPRSGMLHASLGYRALADGDIVHVEPIPSFRGYSSRMQRPKVIGAPTEEQLRCAETMIRIQDEQYRAMKPGVIAKDVDRIVREGMLAAGLRDSYTNITGYSLGCVAPPRLTDFTRVFVDNSDWKLCENQVFHMYTSACGMAFSETIVVTPRGGVRLTKLERKLFC